MSLTIPFLGFSYHPHQESAVRWMIDRESDDAEYFRGGVLADEMGLGKTWMTIGLLLNAPLPQTLLLVPPVLQGQWTEALQQCSIPHRVLRGAKKDGSGLWTVIAGRVAGISVTLCTYDRAMYNSTILGRDTYDRIVADEGHVLRNGPTTRRFRATAEFRAARRWILSGTPIQNNKSDFQNLVKWLGMDDERRIATSSVLLASGCILRRTVGEVRDAVPAMPTVLPTHVIHPVIMPVDSEEASVFSALVGRFEHAIERHAKASIILELYLRIQQFLAHPAVYVDAMMRKYKGEYGRQSWAGTASKMREFKTWLAAADDQPTIVFTTYRLHMDLAAEAMTDAGYAVTRICGGMSDAGRAAAIAESRVAAAAGTKTAMLVQIVAGSAGLNLQHCTRVVFLTSHWNPAVVDQAVARSYRMGQTSTVSVHHFLLADDAEKNIDRLMTGRHGVKRAIAVGIHPKLYCESAVNSDSVMDQLNAVLPHVVVVEDPGADMIVEAPEDPQ